MDGILFDSERHYMRGTVEWMTELGYDGNPESIYRIMGTTMDVTYDILYGLLEGRVPREELIRINEDYFLNRHPVNTGELMFPDVKEALQVLKEEGIRMAVCSGSSADLIRTSLEEMGIREYFQCVISAEDCAHSKPAPDVYLRAADELGVRPQECIVYEDSAAGIAAGRAAGMFTAARKDSRFCQDQSGADVIVNNCMELAEIVRKENRYAGSNED